MLITEAKLRRIVHEEFKQELSEQGLLGNLVAGATGAVKGAVAGAQTGGVGGAVKGAVGGAQSGVAANQKVAQTAAALRSRVSQGEGVGMSKMAAEPMNLVLYLMDWGGNPNDQNSSGRAFWALLKLISIQKQNFTAIAPQLKAVSSAAEKDQAMGAFVRAVVEATGVGKDDPRWFPTLADMITRNKVV